MISTNASGLGKIIIADIERGETLYACIQKCLTDNGVENAVILSGVATFDILHYHYVANDDPIPKEHHVHEYGAFEVASINGFILHGVPHIHFSANDLNSGRNISAHLEPDTRVLYVAELVMAEVKELGEFTRVSYPDRVVLP